MKSPGDRHGGIAAWSIHHPIGVTMLALALVVLGVFSGARLPVDLLPHLIYPEVRVRILDPGVPATIMEDRVTRQLEEQLAITEDAISVQSSSNEGSASVDLSFPYGKDIDVALRDASTRLDRAKRFLPDTIQPPVIYKRDPSQIPVAEFVVSSTEWSARQLRDWVDYDFSKQLINLPGVAAVEVGGGVLREVQVLPDPQRLAAVGLAAGDLVDALREANVEAPAGRLTMARREISGRTAARFDSIEAIRALPIRLADGTTLPLAELARVVDGHSDERIRVRLDGVPGVKVSIQKQPSANTVAVVEAVRARLDWLAEQRLVPAGIEVRDVEDQAVYVRNALTNAGAAALSGTVLAMLVVYLFLGNLRRTLIIGSAIPLAVMVTLVLMGAGGLTFNIMTLGGLALGVGLLVDNTIVMLENIQRHQRLGEPHLEAGQRAAGEINSAIVAATSTNLAAVLPFLFIGGLIGLLFRELIFTISSAILASMVVALTLVPALAVRVRTGDGGPVRRLVDGMMHHLQRLYARSVAALLHHLWLQGLLVLALVAALVWSVPTFFADSQEFLPRMDDGQVRVSVTADPGISLDEMDRGIRRLETLLQSKDEVQSVFTLAGGFIFGRTEREVSNRSSLSVQLVPRSLRGFSSDEWIERIEAEIQALQLAGFRVRLSTRGIRGIRLSSGDEDVSLRIQGPALATLERLGAALAEHLKPIPGLRNLQSSAEETRQELEVKLDRQRVADLGLDARMIADNLYLALEGRVVSDYLDDDRAYPIRVRLARGDLASPRDLEQVILFLDDGRSLRLAEVATVELAVTPAEIKRDNQRRIVEVSASLTGEFAPGEVYSRIQGALTDFPLPPGYSIYDGGAFETLKEGRQLGQVLLGLALFLVFTVMAVQYESLRNPLVIMLSVPFAVTGVAAGLNLMELPLSMPVWLGMIMLAGIVVNNAIVLVEYVEIGRERGMATVEALVEAARLRLRPILMTTLTTVAGMLPLAAGIGEGAEMLQPLAVAIVSGLSFSLLVSLLLVPVLYRWLHPERGGAVADAAAA